MKKLLPTSTTLSVNNKAFTLVELMVVIAIIAILSAIGMVIFTQVQKKARDTRRIADINSISKALEIYYNENNSTYPSTLGSATSNADKLPQTALGSYFSGNTVPKDPQDNNTTRFYYYNSSTPNNNYQVCAMLEDPNNGGNSQWRTAINPTPTLYYYCRFSLQQ